jgi:hypothetical protein
MSTIEQALFTCLGGSHLEASIYCYRVPKMLTALLSGLWTSALSSTNAELSVGQ